MQSKVCSKCKIEKSFSEFFRDNRKNMGIRSCCKACDKEKTYNWRIKNRSVYNNYTAAWRAKNPERQHKMEIKRRYSLSIERYNEMLAAQKCQCKICGKQHDPSLSRGRLYVDHDKETGVVRGLLCGACNSGIGYLLHDIKILSNAIKYLE